MKTIIFILTIFVTVQSHAQTPWNSKPSECWTKTPMDGGGGEHGMLEIVVHPELLTSGAEAFEIVDDLQKMGLNLNDLFGVTSQYTLENGNVIIGNVNLPDAKKSFRLNLKLTERLNGLIDESNEALDKNFEMLKKKHPAIDSIFGCVRLVGPGIRVGG